MIKSNARHESKARYCIIHFCTYHERFDFRLRFPRTDLSFITLESPTAAKRMSYKEYTYFFFQKTPTKVITVLTEYLIHITGFTTWLNFFLGILFNITQSGKIYIQNRKTIKSIVNVQYHPCTF